MTVAGSMNWTNTPVILGFVMVESIIRISDGFGDRIGLPVTLFVRYPLSLLFRSKNLYVPVEKKNPSRTSGILRFYGWTEK